jgi:hypothetical protein
MQLHFPDIFTIYDRLPLPVMKADLWRYCIIYIYGGIYADSDTILNEDPNIFISDKYLMVAPEKNNVHFCQWVFAAPRGSPILKSIIDLSVKRISETECIKGEHIIHYLTGPGVFSDGIINYLISKNYKIHTDPTNKKRNVIEYEDNLIDEMHVFAHDTFHQHKVLHLFSGNWENGWIKQRNMLLL